MTANTLGRSIHDLRKATGRTLQQISAETGIAPSYLSLIERGKVENPGIFTIQKIADALGVFLVNIVDYEVYD